MSKNKFTYKKLKNLLSIGHEIEFIYQDFFCSINNFTDENDKSAWYFSTSLSSTYLADFYDTDALLTAIDHLRLGEKSLEEIIDKNLYDPSSLTIF